MSVRHSSNAEHGASGVTPIGRANGTRLSLRDRCEDRRRKCRRGECGMPTIATDITNTITGNNASRRTENAFGELTSQNFLNIILTEMTRQDPLSPSDTSALLQQLASIRSIESDLQLGERLDSIVQQSQFSSAASLIGKLVSGLDENNTSAAGFVVSISRTKDGPALNLDNGQRMLFSGLNEMVDPDLFTPPTENTTPSNEQNNNTSDNDKNDNTDENTEVE